MATLSPEQIDQELRSLEGWSGGPNGITRKLTFRDFVGSMGFVNQVALLAERADHHPDITINWNRVTLTLVTHSAGGVTERDIKMARKIDALGAG